MMKSKKTLGLIILLAGVVVFIFAKYHSEDKASISIGTNRYDTPGGGTATIEIKGRDDNKLKPGEIVGIILMVFGAGMFFFYRKKA